MYIIIRTHKSTEHVLIIIYIGHVFVCVLLLYI